MSFLFESGGVFYKKQKKAVITLIEMKLILQRTRRVHTHMQFNGGGGGSSASTWIRLENANILERKTKMETYSLCFGSCSTRKRFETPFTKAVFIIRSIEIATM